jgi:ketosteroid isomerase-like protein
MTAGATANAHAATAQAILDSINRRDLAATLGLLDPGYEATWPHATLALAEAGAHEATILAAIPDTHFDIIGIVGEGQTVVVELIATGTVTGRVEVEPFAPADPNGGSLRLPMCFVMRFSDEGRLVRETLYFDQTTFAAQMGTVLRTH